MSINATLLSQTIAFVIFVAICWKYVWPPIISIMEEREKRIADGLEAAKKADDSLEEAQLEFDQKMNKAKEEAAEILNKANTRASQIVANASIKAEAEAEKILSAASKTIENDANKAKEELKQKISGLIIDTSEKILEEEIDPDKHQNLLKKAASEL